MALLDDYIQEIGFDTKVDEMNLKSVEFKLPAIKHKWVGRYIRHKQELFKIQKSKEKLTKETAIKLVEQAHVKITNATAVRTVQETDSIKQLDEKIEELKLILELLEKTEKIFSSMSFDLRTIVDTVKLEQA